MEYKIPEKKCAVCRRPIEQTESDRIYKLKNDV